MRLITGEDPDVERAIAGESLACECGISCDDVQLQVH